MPDDSVIPLKQIAMRYYGYVVWIMTVAMFGTVGFFLLGGLSGFLNGELCSFFFLLMKVSLVVAILCVLVCVLIAAIGIFRITLRRMLSTTLLLATGLALIQSTLPLVKVVGFLCACASVIIWMVTWVDSFDNASIDPSTKKN